MSKNEGYIFIDDTGKVISEVMFEYIEHMTGDIYYIRRIDFKENYLNIKTGKLLSKEWFYFAWEFQDGYARVCRCRYNNFENKEYNFIDLEGNYLSEKWFSSVDGFRDGIAIVTNEFNEDCFIDTKGNIMVCTNEELLNCQIMKYKNIINEYKGS